MSPPTLFFIFKSILVVQCSWDSIWILGWLLFCKKMSWDFDRDSIETVNCFGLHWHLDDIEISSLWMWNIFPLIYVFINFFQHYFVVFSVTSSVSLYKFLKKFIHFRERSHEQGEGQKEMERISSRLPTECGAWLWGSVLPPWDHDLSWNQELAALLTEPPRCPLFLNIFLFDANVSRIGSLISF